MGTEPSATRNDSHRGRTQSGFTLIEMIASLALLGLLAAIFGMGLVSAVESYDFSRANAQVAQKSQMAMTRMVRELTDLTRIVHLDNGSDPYIVYERLQEINGRPTTTRWGLHFNAADQRVRLYENPPDQLDGTTIAQGDVLVDSVQGFSLRYYLGGSEWTTWPFTAAPSTIQITLSLRRPDGATQPQNFTTLIHLRNNQNDGGALR